MTGHETPPTHSNSGEERAHEVTADELEPTPRPRPGIWVARYEHTPFGSWCDAYGTVERVQSRIGDKQILDTIEFGTFEVKPDETAEVVARVANGIREHGYAFAAWADFHDADPDLLAAFRDHYIGEFASYDDLGRALSIQTEEQLPDELRPHVRIDYEALARDQTGGVRLFTLEGPEGVVWLFQGPNK